MDTCRATGWREEPCKACEEVGESTSASLEDDGRLLMRMKKHAWRDPGDHAGRVIMKHVAIAQGV
ncbi:hypothetical protein Scep_026771 [Stephania cephalantha]|uniref:Uncharacterized protein n=1 Tax=Stephania cephalantha TaxID=152367 RepID=A0AAP0ENZ6_9MAGN